MSSHERLDKARDDEESQAPAERRFISAGDALDAEVPLSDAIESRFFDSDETVNNYLASFSGGVPRPEISAEYEELLEEYSDNLHARLKALGIRDPDSIDELFTKTLLDAGYLDVDSVEDLYYWIWDYAKKELGPFTRVKPAFLLEAADRVDSTILQNTQDKEAMSNLIALGVKSDELFESSHGSYKRNLRRLSWLFTSEVVLEDKTLGLKISAASGDQHNLAKLSELAQSTLVEARDRLLNINTDTLETSIDSIKIKSEIERLKYIINLANSVQFSAGDN